MLTTLGIVQIPSSRSSAQARRLLGRHFGGKPLLDWVLRRLTESLRLDGVIAVANSERDYETLLPLVPSDVPLVAQGEADALGSVAAALRRFPAEAVVRVSLETPFVDPVLIDQLVSTAEQNPGCDYIGYTSSDGRSAVDSNIGVFGEWVRAESIRRAHRKSSNPRERQEATCFIRMRPDLFKLCYLPVPAALDRDDFRLKLAFDEDWDHAESIYEALGPDGLEWQRIARLVEDQPAIRERMAVLNRAEAVV